MQSPISPIEEAIFQLDQLQARIQELMRFQQWLIQRNMELVQENAKLKALIGAREKEETSEKRQPSSPVPRYHASEHNLWPGSWTGY